MNLFGGWFVKRVRENIVRAITCSNFQATLVDATFPPKITCDWQIHNGGSFDIVPTDVKLYLFKDSWEVASIQGKLQLSQVSEGRLDLAKIAPGSDRVMSITVTPDLRFWMIDEEISLYLRNSTIGFQTTWGYVEALLSNVGPAKFRVSQIGKDHLGTVSFKLSKDYLK